MVERATSLDKLLPCLLDRLTDDYPKAKKEGRDQSVVTIRKYRKSVLRDLRLLLNSISHPDEMEFKEFEYARTSVLNYGVKDFSGIWVSNRNISAIESQIREAILNFEQRIIRETLVIRLTDQEDEGNKSKTVVNLEIIGEIWAEPVPESLYIKTEVDLETGFFEIIES